jgi:hypothetical protein
MSTPTIITPVAGSAAIQAAPAAPLTASQQRLLMYFNRINREGQDYALGILQDMSENAPALVPKRAFRVIAGGA